MAKTLFSAGRTGAGFALIEEILSDILVAQRFPLTRGHSDKRGPKGT